MKKIFEIFWAAVAEKDLFTIVETITDEHPGTALNILKKIKTETDRLIHFPKRGRIVPELMKHGISRYREIVIKPWRVVYPVEGSKVYVVAVIDGRRNVEDVLLERLLK